MEARNNRVILAIGRSEIDVMPQCVRGAGVYGMRPPLAEQEIRERLRHTKLPIYSAVRHVGCLPAVRSGRGSCGPAGRERITACWENRS